MQHIPVKFVPRLFTNEQKHWHLFVFKEMLDQVRNDQTSSQGP
jgi:hypothetical protein